MPKKLGIVRRTVSLPAELDRRMEQHADVNWSEVARAAFESKLVERVKEAKEKAMVANVERQRKSQEYWREMAYACAKDAYDNNLPSHRGYYAIRAAAIPPGEVVCIYNNHPWELDGGASTKRDAVTTSFRRQMKTAGIRELAYQTYPTKGESVGYTYAMLVDAREEQIPFVEELMTRAKDEADADRESREDNAAHALKRYLREQLPAEIAANRMNCIAILFSLAVAMDQPTSTETLAERLTELEDEVSFISREECEEILSELLRANIVELCGSNGYILSEKNRSYAHTILKQYGFGESLGSK